MRCEDPVVGNGLACQQGDLVELADRFRSGERLAFSEAVRLFLPRVIRQARFFLGSLTEAEDVAQEVFLKAFAASGSLKGQRIWPWLARITHNHCLNVLRDRSRQPVAPVLHVETLSGRQPSYPGDPSPSSTAFPDLLGLLTPVEREVLSLRVVEELPFAEIASIVGMTEGSTRNVVSRALQRLREEIGGHGM